MVTTYETANNERNVLQKFAWWYLIIDEAHRIKNENATFSKTVTLTTHPPCLFLYFPCLPACLLACLLPSSRSSLGGSPSSPPVYTGFHCLLEAHLL